MDDPVPPGRVVDAEYDWTATSPSRAVVESVAETSGRDPVDLDVLHEAIDPDALDALVAAGDGAAVRFSYAAHLVTVTAGGTVRVAPCEPRPDGRVED